MANYEIIAIGGYARAGKTTTMEVFKASGYTTFSTSDTVHVVAKDFLTRLGLKGIDTYDKAIEYSLDFSHGYGTHFNQRDFLIAVAESIRTIDPLFFATALVKDVVAARNKGLRIAFETIGGPEYSFIKEELERRGCPVVEEYNIRSPFEQRGVDIRELIPGGLDLWNAGTIESFEYRLKLFVTRAIQ